MREVRGLAVNILAGGVWHVAGNANPEKKYRGQVALAIALDGALLPPENSATRKKALDWYTDGLQLAADLRQHVERAPPNLIAVQPGIDLPAAHGGAHLIDLLQTFITRLENPRFKYTMHGAQTAVQTKYFVRSMTLFWRGMRIGDCYELTAVLVRQIFGRDCYKTFHCKRDAEEQPLPGKVTPWGWGLDDEAWRAALVELIESKGYRNTANSADFLDKHDTSSPLRSTKASQLKLVQN